MTVLVTGATGTVGQHLVKHLLDLGAEVRCLTRDPDRAEFPDSVEVVAGDLSDPATLGAAFRGVEAAHLITFSGDDYRPLEHGDQIIAGLAHAGAQRVTLLKGDVDSSPIETAARHSAVESTALAPVESMANMLEWADGVRAGQLEEGFADMPSTVVHEADIAAVAAHVLVRGGHPGETLWVTGPEALTVHERVEIIHGVTGQPIELVSLTPDQMQQRWLDYGLSEDDVEFMTLMKTDPPLQARVPQHTVRAVTGQPPRTFHEWVQENRHFFESS